MSLFDNASLVVTPNGVKEDKLYSIKPTDGSGDLVVTRATTATRVNSAGLVELVPYNLITYSEQFDNAAWGKLGVSVTANQTTAPDGNNTADLVTTTNATSHELLQSKIATGVHTCSFYVKKNNSQTFYINMYPNGWTAYFNLNNGTVSSVVGSGVTANVTNAGNGWYRCSMTFTSVGSEIQLGFLDTVYTGVAGNPWTISTSVGTSGYVWGAQLVSGTSAKEYFPTTDRLDIPRLDYTNSSCPSILVEPQRTNVVTYSEQFDNANWVKLNATITANTSVAPTGNTTADTLTITSGGYLLQTLFGYNAVSGQSITISIFAKNQITNFLKFGGATTAGNDVYTIQDYGNGWYRHIRTRTFTTSNPSALIQFIIFDTIGTHIVWGAQMETNSTYATSYIPTIASTVTRNSDVISKTGISSLIGQTEGTVLFDADVTNTTGLQIGTTDGGSDYINSIQIAFGSSSTNINVFNGGTPQFSYAGGISTGRKKIAIAYKANDFALYINGVQVATDTSGSIPALSGLFFNHQNLATTNGKINLTALWKTRLSNTELATLTTI